MKPWGLFSNALARVLDVTPARINDIVRGRCGINADTALRLARFFGTDAQSWLNLQSHYDIQCAEDDAGRAIGRIRPMKVMAEKVGESLRSGAHPVVNA